MEVLDQDWNFALKQERDRALIYVAQNGDSKPKEFGGPRDYRVPSTERCIEFL